MDEIKQLKNDIIQTQKLLNQEKIKIKQQIDEGWLDDMDYVLESNPNYFNETMQKINPFPEEEKEYKNKPKKGLSKLLEKIKKIM